MPTSSFKGNEVLGSLEGQCSIYLSGSEKSVDRQSHSNPLTYVQLPEFPQRDLSAPEKITATEDIDGTTEKNLF